MIPTSYEAKKNESKKEPGEVDFRDFGRKFPRLTWENAPRYHETLQRLLGLVDKTSLKIETCGIGARRIDCDGEKSTVLHSKYVPVTCNRRTCPECAWQDMKDRIRQFEPIGEIGYQYRNHPDMRVRFWTLTIRAAKPETDLKPYFDGLKQSLFDLWRALFGDNARRHAERPEDLKKAGGVFFMEVQEGWNPHLHGLVLSPFFRVEHVRAIWKKVVKKNGLSGSRIEIKEPYIKGAKHAKLPCRTPEDYHQAIMEIVSYPIRPDKGGRHDPVLMAYVEAGLQGHRRYICKGDWYNRFERPESHAICGECAGGFTHEELYDDFAKLTKQNFFPENETGLRNWQDHGYHFPKALIAELMAKQNEFPTPERMA